MSPVAVLRIIAFYILAVLVAILLGCLVQAQLHLRDCRLRMCRSV